jgi:hypothetical protein
MNEQPQIAEDEKNTGDGRLLLKVLVLANIIIFFTYQTAQQREFFHLHVGFMLVADPLC